MLRMKYRRIFGDFEENNKAGFSRCADDRRNLEPSRQVDAGRQMDTVTNYKYRFWLLEFLTGKIGSEDFGTI